MFCRAPGIGEREQRGIHRGGEMRGEHGRGGGEGERIRNKVAPFVARVTTTHHIATVFREPAQRRDGGDKLVRRRRAVQRSTQRAFHIGNSCDDRHITLGLLFCFNEK